MKIYIKKGVPVIMAGIIISLFLGCRPLPDKEDLFYHVIYTVSGDVPTADISYYDENQEKVSLIAQDLPWSMTVEVPKSLPGTAYLGVKAESDSVFLPVFTGISTIYEERKVHCNGGFSGQVISGDILFADPDPVPHETEYTEVLEVISDTTLSLASDLISAGSMPFSIYRDRYITLTIKVNDSILEEKTENDPFNISFYTQELIGKAEDDEDD